ncbi:MAG TPA: FadD3 family acyl-CoA ligase [Acidimicrobiales bacterium]|nr:FadD3 family acyl-CoA ligase [Acidimicrobiales bacterium]
MTAAVPEPEQPSQPSQQPWRNIPAVAQDAAGRFGDAEAVVDGQRRVSFADLWADGERLARAFVGAGIEPGDRVAIWAPNSYEWVVSLLGLQAAGAALVPLNTRFRSFEAAYILNRSRARVLVTIGKFLGVDYPGLLASEDLPHLERLVVVGPPGSEPPGGRGRRPTPPGAGEAISWEAFAAGGDDVDPQEVAARLDAIGPDDVSDLIFTSGTTGAPKGVVATHGQSIRTFAEWSRIVGVATGDRYLLVNPMFHTFGYKAGILACLMAGATMIPLAVFDPGAVVERIATERVTVMPGPPTLYQSLLHHPELGKSDLSTLRLAVTGAAVVPVELVKAMRDDLGFDVVLTAYGLTEATGFVTATTPDDDLETIATTSGRAIDGVEVRVVDSAGTALEPGAPGEVVCRGFNVMKGYFEDPEATAAAIDAGGWLHTGDVGVLDDRGNLRITDRIKDMFIVGGFNAYPAEIETLLLAHGGIAQAAVVGVPDERLGEVGVAFVVPKPGKALDPAEIVAWAGEHMANYKAPRQVHVVEALPLNASGKVLRYELRQRLRP